MNDRAMKSPPCHNKCCPFAWTAESEQAQNYGCLPAQSDFFDVWEVHGLVISCHENTSRKCVGFLIEAKERNIHIPPKAQIIPNFGGTSDPQELAAWREIKLRGGSQA